MKKIMFNETYGLTSAAIDGTKTMTRRMISKNFPTEGVESIGIDKGGNVLFKIGDNYEPVKITTPYKVGEFVAIAQSYKDIYEELKMTHGSSSYVTRQFFHKYIQGGRMPVSNKMFVRADLMLHRIRITDIKVERLQDISDEDCLKEGIFQWRDPFHEDRIKDFGFFGATKHYITAKEAFSILIDKVSGSGTWENNPWVFAYSFELIK